MDCIRTGDNLLLNLFSNLQYDIQEKIYHYTLIEKQKDYNRRILYSGKIIHQLNNLMRDHKDYMNEFKEVETFTEYLMNIEKMNYLYDDYGVGKRLVNDIDNNEEDYDCVDKTLDKLYYSDLDYIFMCDLTTKIDIDNTEIEHKYKIKDNYKHLSLNNQEKRYSEEEEEDNWGLSIRKEFCMSYHLTDWLMEKVDCYDIDEDQYEFISELINSDYEMIERDTECLKRYLFDLKSRLNVFYNREENQQHYDNQI